MKKNNYFVVFITLVVLIFATVSLVGLSDSRESSVCEHKYSKFKQVSSPELFAVGEKHKVCRRCGHTVSEKINATVSLPQMYLDGELQAVSKTTQEVFRVEYIDKSESFSAYAAIRYQGHTAMNYEKKNFTIKFYKDEIADNKHAVSFNGWNKTHKYCLKANYIDFSSARNIVSSNIWSDVVSCRENIDKNISQLEFSGGIDGFPVALFVNGEYRGLYTLNIAKDDDTFHIADDENEALFVINSEFSDSAKFRAPISERDKKDVFDLEYVYGDNEQFAYESLNRLIEFVMENEGEAFRKGIREYLDVESAIDYLITTYILGLTDNFSKNMILITYDGKKWIPNLYDLDTAAGLRFDGTGFFPEDFSLPFINSTGKILSGADNLLWDRIISEFTDEFILRYDQLKKDVLKTENIIKRYAYFIQAVPEECYSEEKLLYPNRNYIQIDPDVQISEYLTKRSKNLDKIINEIRKEAVK
ncbi:MAG: CotH kinase family protein [Acutalibacteraceae bacterium]|nr:CotH kinase family protein [Acutalibacteraceae bacterium]